LTVGGCVLSSSSLSYKHVHTHAHTHTRAHTHMHTHLHKRLGDRHGRLSGGRELPALSDVGGGHPAEHHGALCMYIYVGRHRCMYIYIYVCVCVYVCIDVFDMQICRCVDISIDRERGERGRYGAYIRGEERGQVWLGVSVYARICMDKWINHSTTAAACSTQDIICTLGTRPQKHTPHIPPTKPTLSHRHTTHPLIPHPANRANSHTPLHISTTRTPQNTTRPTTPSTPPPLC
jgi:hypothetical protein